MQWNLKNTSLQISKQNNITVANQDCDRLEADQKASHSIFEIWNYSSAEMQKRRLVDYFLQ